MEEQDSPQSQDSPTNVSPSSSPQRPPSSDVEGEGGGESGGENINGEEGLSGATAANGFVLNLAMEGLQICTEDNEEEGTSGDEENHVRSEEFQFDLNEIPPDDDEDEDEDEDEREP